MNRKYFEREAAHIKTTPFGIFVDQAGYLPESRKIAVLPFEAESFELADESGSVRYTGKTSYFGKDEASGDDIRLADFSGFREPGKYRVRAEGQLSAQFGISESVYDSVLRDTMRAFYYLRCGCALEEKYALQYVHPACHTSEAVLWDDHSVRLEVTGGWHDAGDYGRYVTAGACAVGHLLYAYKLFPKAFEKLSLNIPETGLPDLLAEVKYELDWMLKMQREDGGVYHKVTTAQHAPFVMPEEDKAQLFVFKVTTMATADLAAAAALASGIYRPFDTAFADKLAEASERALGWLEANPEFIGFENPPGCNTGPYGQRDANSNIFWAYAEAYSLTGDERRHKAMLEMKDKGFPLTGLGYGELGGLGALCYLLCERDKDEETASAFRQAFADRAARLRSMADSCGYGVAMEPYEYCWGSNMNTMKNGMVLAIDDLLSGSSRNRSYAEGQLHYLLGENALGISYVTGTGEFRCNYPHLRPAFADGIEECMPGMVSGGPNRRPGDPFAYEVIREGTPPMRCYADDTSSYSLNEITIYWNSPTVFLLGYIIGE